MVTGEYLTRAGDRWLVSRRSPMWRPPNMPRRDGAKPG